MRRRRSEFIYLIILALSMYMMVFSSAGFLVKLFFGVLYTIALFITLFSLMLENRSSHHTLLWMGILVFLPIGGYIFYLFSGQLYLKGHLFKSKRRKDRAEWKDLVNDITDPDLSFLNDHQTCFSTFAKNTSQTSFSTGTNTKVLKNGKETFPEIITELEKAQNYIHIEYYIFRSDRIGKKVMEILCDKARAGVEVLFTFDAAGSMKLDKKAIQDMKDAGVNVQPFLPLKYGFFNQKLNFRNHRKIIIIDGKVGFVGGLNVGDEYLGKNKEIGFWRDTHLKVEGEAVYTLHTVFLLDWEYVSGEDVLTERPQLKQTDKKGDGAVQVVASGPDTQQGIMSDFYYGLFSCATKSIWIATPYFVPNEAIRAALKVAAKKGVQVRLMIPKINDGFLTQYASRSFFTELLNEGVEVYSYTKGFLHQKVIIVDGDMASIGTANMDMRSFHLNFEVNVFMLENSSIADLVSHYESDILDSELVELSEYKKRSLGERSKESFARLFSDVL